MLIPSPPSPTLLAMSNGNAPPAGTAPSRSPPPPPMIDTDPESLREAALSIPDTDQVTSPPGMRSNATSAGLVISPGAQGGPTDMDLDNISIASLSSITTRRTASSAANEGTNENADSLFGDPDEESPSTDWDRILSMSGQGLSAATSATSLGFSTARALTAFSLNIAKQITQGVVSLPAMAIDAGITGQAPNASSQHGRDSTLSATQVAQTAVGGLFDIISTLALGGIDVGQAVTGASLGAAGAGVEGVRRAMGSEVLRSLSAFAKLVKREWNSTDETLPPGGLPVYSTLRITQALTTWVCIQMVTQKHFESKMLRQLEEIDLSKLKAEAERRRARLQAAQASSEGGQPAAHPASSQEVRITSERSLPGQEGDVIGATIGSASAPGPENVDPATETSQELLLDEMQLLHRYSRLVLGVYGGTALWYLGSLPADFITSGDNSQASGAADTALPRPSQPQSDMPLLGLEGIPHTTRQDEDEFLRAAETLDLDDDEVAAAAEAYRARLNGRGEGSGAAAVTAGASARRPAPGDVLFSSPDDLPSYDESITGSGDRTPPQQAPAPSRSFMEVISGQHDAEIFHRVAGLQDGHAQEGAYTETHESARPRPKSRVARTSKPRYYIVTDHSQRKVVLVLRGSLSLGDFATDLTCESAAFPFDQGNREASDAQREDNLVHEGMLETALEIGATARPVHKAVAAALATNKTYDLDITGHSLGAGVASLLALMWASPETQLSTAESGLPPGRRVHAYAFAVPCVMTDHLATRCKELVSSFICSYDLVSRLSLGSILDIRSAVAWICYEDSNRGAPNANRAPSGTDSDAVSIASLDRIRPEALSMNSIIQRAFRYRGGQLDAAAKEALEVEYLAIRSTLEASMQHVHLLPPGDCIHAFQSEDLVTPASPSAPAAPSSGRRFFKLKNGADARQRMYGQILFSRSMLSCHMPDFYAKALAEVPN